MVGLRTRTQTQYEAGAECWKRAGHWPSLADDRLPRRAAIGQHLCGVHVRINVVVRLLDLAAGSDEIGYATRHLGVRGIGGSDCHRELSIGVGEQMERKRLRRDELFVRLRLVERYTNHS